MVKIVDFYEKFCWRRKKFQLDNQQFTLIAGYSKIDRYDEDAETAMRMQGYLIHNNGITAIPAKEGIFIIQNLIFCIVKTGIFLDIIKENA